MSERLNGDKGTTPVCIGEVLGKGVVSRYYRLGDVDPEAFIKDGALMVNQKPASETLSGEAEFEVVYPYYEESLGVRYEKVEGVRYRVVCRRGRFSEDGFVGVARWVRHVDLNGVEASEIWYYQ